MPTVTAGLKKQRQDYKLSVDMLGPRNFRVADVNVDGTDTPYTGTTFPPAADPEPAAPAVTAFDAITTISSIVGSIDSGGFSAEFTVPKYPATFTDYVGLELKITSWHGGVIGTIGAAGTDVTPVLIYRGFARRVVATRGYNSEVARFTIASSSSFLRDAELGRGIDWHAGNADHTAPAALWDIADELITQHTNLKPRSIVGYYIPNPTLDRLAINPGSIYGILKGLADSVAIEGWVYCDREDNLQVRCHPILRPDTWAAELASPIIDIDDEMVIGENAWTVPEEPPASVSSVSLTATTSDGQQITRNASSGSNVGSHRSISGLRYDDPDELQTMADRYVDYANRRYRAVQVRTPLNVATDLGNIVAITTTLPQRGITWAAKAMVCVGIQYDFNLADQTVQTVLTLDEAVL